MADIVRLLPDSVANQIAAGEVIQRPASAVKELLENAIDAGATEIELIIKDAGKTLIQIIDNGCGMSETDARLCFERHATSKIKAADDLFSIRTMGFRGEALASIAAIAQVELKSKLHDSELGTQILINGSVVEEQKVCQCNSGTSISVKNLFYNVPARRNFLKSDPVELGHIEEEFKRVALPNPNIAFSFYSNGKLLYKLDKASFLQRIVGVFGDNYKERLLPAEQKTNIIDVSGYVAKAEFAKKTRGEQYFFVNKRFIKHPYLHHAVENAFDELLADRLIPSYFLCLEIDPGQIDINIHPTKTEIKFIDEKPIYAILRSTVKKALGQFTLSSQIEFDMDAGIQLNAPPKGYIPKPPSVNINPMFNPFEERKKSDSGSGQATTHREISNKENWQKFYETPKERTFQSEMPLETPATESLPMQESYQADIIQVHNRYIVTTLKSGLAIIDQQRAHERVLYERFLQADNSPSNVSQQLLFPVNCNFSPANSEILIEILPELKAFGFDINEFGNNSFLISGTPEGIQQENVPDILESFIEGYKNSLLQKFSNRREGAAASLAKQMAVKAGKKLKQEEMQEIVAQLFTCKSPAVSIWGKKTILFLTEQELNEKFNKI